MYGNSVISTFWITILLFGLLSSDQAKGFIFPDLLRSGNRLQSRYKIGVLQEEPFLGVDGTGYVPDLLRLVAQWYSSTSTEDSDSFQYDIHPVDTWDQLLTMASATHWVSFGLIAPSLTKTEDTRKSLTYSHSAVHTGLQMVGATKRKTKTSTLRGSNATAIRQVATTTTTKLSVHSPGGVQFDFGGLDVKSAVFVALNGSPELYVTQRYAGDSLKVKTVKNNDEALGYILRHPNSYLIKDSAVSYRMEEQFHSELAVVCKWRANVARPLFHHGFFGRDVVVINFLNDALRKLRSGEKDRIKMLNRKYFGHLRTCLH